MYMIAEDTEMTTDRNEMTATQKENLEALKTAFYNAGLDYVISRLDNDLAHVNVWIGKKL